MVKSENQSRWRDWWTGVRIGFTAAMIIVAGLSDAALLAYPKESLSGKFALSAVIFGVAVFLWAMVLVLFDD